MGGGVDLVRAGARPGRVVLAVIEERNRKAHADPVASRLVTRDDEVVASVGERNGRVGDRAMRCERFVGQRGGPLALERADIGPRLETLPDVLHFGRQAGRGVQRFYATLRDRARRLDRGPAIGEGRLVLCAVAVRVELEGGRIENEAVVVVAADVSLVEPHFLETEHAARLIEVPRKHVLAALEEDDSGERGAGVGYLLRERVQVALTGGIREIAGRIDPVRALSELDGLRDSHGVVERVARGKPGRVRLAEGDCPGSHRQAGVGEQTARGQLLLGLGEARGRGRDLAIVLLDPGDEPGCVRDELLGRRRCFGCCLRRSLRRSRSLGGTRVAGYACDEKGGNKPDMRRLSPRTANNRFLACVGSFHAARSGSCLSDGRDKARSVPAESRARWAKSGQIAAARAGGV